MHSGALYATFTGHSQWVSSIDFSPSGHHMISGSNDKTSRIWNIWTRDPDPVLTMCVKQQVNCVAFSPCGQRVAAGSFQGSIFIWAFPSGDTTRFIGHHLTVRSIAFSPDGRTLASTAYDCVSLWSAEPAEPSLGCNETDVKHREKTLQSILVQ